MNKLIDLNLLRQFKTNLDEKMTKLDEEQDKKMEAALEEVNGRVEDLNANFTMAAKKLGDILAAKGIPVTLEESLDSLIGKVEILKNISSSSPTIIYSVSNKDINSSITGGFTGYATRQSGANGYLMVETNNYIRLNDILNISGIFNGNYTEGSAYIALLSSTGTETTIGSVRNFTGNASIATKTISANVASYTGNYKIRIYVGNTKGLSNNLVSTITCQSVSILA